MARKLRITKTDGTRYEITIPDDAQITYGNLHPGSKAGYHPAEKDDKYVLRVYEGNGANKRQTAVFRGVDEFIDLNYDLVRIDNVDFDEIDLPIPKIVQGTATTQQPQEVQWVVSNTTATTIDLPSEWEEVTENTLEASDFI